MSKGSQKTIVQYGYRKKAVLKALEMGIKVILISDKKVPSKTKENLSAYFYSPNLQIDRESLSTIKKLNPDAVAPMVERGVVPAAGLRKSLGCEGINNSEIFHDKLLMKDRASAFGIPTAEYMKVDVKTDPNAIADQLGFPFFLKNRGLSGSRGQIYIEDEHELERLVVFDGIAEAKLTGKEYSAEVFVQDSKIVFANITDYYRHHVINLMPKKFDPQTSMKVMDFLKKVISAFEVKNEMLHIEFFLNETITLGELAVRPPGGYLMDLLDISYGIDSWKLYLETHLQIPSNIQNPEPKYSAVLILHPGGGIVESIKEFSNLKKIKSFVSMEVKVSEGDRVEARLGSGEDIGHVIFSSNNLEELQRDLDFATQSFYYLVPEKL